MVQRFIFKWDSEHTSFAKIIKQSGTLGRQHEASSEQRAASNEQRVVSLRRKPRSDGRAEQDANAQSY